MKAIIERALPLNEKYTLLDKKYIPLIESFGTCCDNCGKLISNIATVRSESGKVFTIGFDCLETLLINNSLLSTGDIAEYEKARVQIPKVIRAAKKLKETIDNNKHLNITGMLIEKPMFTDSKFYPFYWLSNNHLDSRDNDYIKIKDADFNTMVDTLKNIFPSLTIILK
jgi:hypothetical protein